MDLAFLRPGADYSISAAGPDGRDLEGRLGERRGRPCWVFHQAQPRGRVVSISLKLPGFSLEPDGSLKADSPESEARLVLLAQVRACRYFPPRGVYVWRLKLLGRVWPL